MGKYKIITKLISLLTCVAFTLAQLCLAASADARQAGLRPASSANKPHASRQLRTDVAAQSFSEDKFAQLFIYSGFMAVDFKKENLPAANAQLKTAIQKFAPPILTVLAPFLLGAGPGAGDILSDVFAAGIAVTFGVGGFFIFRKMPTLLERIGIWKARATLSTALYTGAVALLCWQCAVWLAKNPGLTGSLLLWSALQGVLWGGFWWAGAGCLLVTASYAFVKWNIRMLGAKSEQVRQEAIEKLASEWLLPLLTAELKYKNTAVRRGVAAVLKRISFNAVAALTLDDAKELRDAESLIGALTDGASTTYASAAAALKILETRALPPLIEALKNENASVRDGAIVALCSEFYWGKLNDQALIDALKHAVRETSDAEVKRLAMPLLVEIRAPDALKELLESEPSIAEGNRRSPGILERVSEDAREGKNSSANKIKDYIYDNFKKKVVEYRVLFTVEELRMMQDMLGKLPPGILSQCEAETIMAEQEAPEKEYGYYHRKSKTAFINVNAHRDKGDFMRGEFLATFVHEVVSHAAIDNMLQNDIARKREFIRLSKRSGRRKANYASSAGHRQAKRGKWREDLASWVEKLFCLDTDGTLKHAIREASRGNYIPLQKCLLILSMAVEDGAVPLYKIDDETGKIAKTTAPIEEIRNRIIAEIPDIKDKIEIKSEWLKPFISATASQVLKDP